jgi:Cu/Ag efflux protein CusF
MKHARISAAYSAAFMMAAFAASAAPVWAQPAKGAPAAFERVREVMANRFKDEKLSEDPDQNFAAMLIASYEQLIFLSKTQLEYGGDRQMREVAQKIQDDEQKQIDDIKQWQVRSRVAGYKAQPDQPPSGTGPLDQQAQAAPAEAPVQAKPATAEPPAQPVAPKMASNAPMVSATIKKLDESTGKVTLDHERIPNVDMDAMTMAYKVQDPAALKGLKAGDKVRFSAEDINGQITVMKIQKAR